MLVAELYHNAEQLETLYGPLVIKNGYLVAEKYFHGKSVDQLSRRASVTRSITSALVGIALEQGCLSSVDQKMIDFFPELAGKIRDPRKSRSPSGICCRCAPDIPGKSPQQSFSILCFAASGHLAWWLISSPPCQANKDPVGIG